MNATPAPIAVNTSSSPEFDPARHALAIISSALEPQAAGQITRQGWAAIESALGTLGQSLDGYQSTAAQSQQRAAHITHLEKQIADLLRVKDKQFERIEKLTAQSHIADIRQDTIDLLKDGLSSANDLCRSLHAVVKRQGIQTNWEALLTQLEKSLKLQHDVMTQVGGFPPQSTPAPFAKIEVDWARLEHPEQATQDSEPPNCENPSQPVETTPKATSPVIPIILLCLSLLLPSCIHYSNSSPTGEKTSLTAIGTDASQLTAGALSVTDLNQSKGVAAVGTAVGNIVKTQVAGSLIRTGIGAAKEATTSAIDALNK